VLGSWKIARLFGIDVRLHWTFFLLILFVLQVQAEPLIGLGVVLVAFGSVLLHELGHSLTARRFGIQVLDITFWPLGGMARMSEIPEEPRVEGWVAIAGPAVNFALVGLAAPLFAASLWFAGPEWLTQALFLFLLINGMLGTFNLVPAFPMDGGRILRAVLARKMDYVRATEVAVKTGRVVVLGMIALALVLSVTSSQKLYAIPLIAIFVWFAGGRELLAVRLRHGLSPFARGPFRGVPFGRDPFARSPFARADAEPRDVELDGKPGSFDGGTPRTDGPRRPVDWQPEVGPRRLRGFSEETLRRLERYPGRLPRAREQDPFDVDE
jgi:Zn-dependent protease